MTEEIQHDHVWTDEEVQQHVSGVGFLGFLAELVYLILRCDLRISPREHLHFPTSILFIYHWSHAKVLRRFIRS